MDKPNIDELLKETEKEIMKLQFEEAIESNPVLKKVYGVFKKNGVDKEQMTDIFIDSLPLIKDEEENDK